jgi:hypothetical protein
VQSFVRWMGLQLVFQLPVVGNFARLLPQFAGVVVGDIVRLRLTGYQT